MRGYFFRKLALRRLLTGYAGAFNRRHRLQRHGYDFNWLLRRLATKAGLPSADLRMPSKVPARVEVRSLLCYSAVREVGLPGTAVAATLGLTQSAVSRAVLRGERLAKDQGWAFPKS